MIDINEPKRTRMTTILETGKQDRISTRILSDNGEWRVTEYTRVEDLRSFSGIPRSMHRPPPKSYYIDHKCSRRTNWHQVHRGFGYCSRCGKDIPKGLEIFISFANEDTI